MKKARTLLILTLLLSSILLGSCNLPTEGSAADADATTIAATSGAVFTHAAETALVSGIPSATSIPSATPIPTNTLIPTSPPPTATNTPIPCNRAEFVKDVTYADNAEVPAGTAFTKTWRLKNTGSCTWTSAYVLLFDSGEKMGAPSVGTFTTGTVAPGAMVDISVELTAPSTPGTYEGKFKLRSPENIVFGINANAQAPFWVKIVVPSPTPTPTNTVEPKADLYITQIEYSPAAPKQGDLVTVKISVYNGGNLDAGAFNVEWYAAGPTLGCTIPVAGAVAKGGHVVSCTYTYGGWNHAYETKAIADSANVIAESDETNNTKTQTLDVSPP